MKPLTLSIAPEYRPFDGDAVLLYYDGPIMFWLPGASVRLLAIALPDEAGPHPFLVVEVPQETADALLGNRMTVRRVCLSAPQSWLMPDYGQDGPLVLTPLASIPEKWLPGDVTLYLET